MKDLFDVVSGTIPGTDHTKKLLWKNNQDAFSIRISDSCIVAVVADGCGSGAYSELGARIGAHTTANLLLKTFATYDYTEDNPKILLHEVQMELLTRLETFVINMVADTKLSRSGYINDHLLFTLVTLVITPKLAFVASIGDGIYAVNGDITCIGPFPGNAPPYIVYGGLVQSSIDPDMCQFTVNKAVATDTLQSICIGTDGAADFLSISESAMPGKKECVGPLSQFWTEDRYFKNPEAIRRRLNLINNPHCQPDWDAREMDIQHGRLKDDTTLVVVRRRPQPKD